MTVSYIRRSSADLDSVMASAQGYLSETIDRGVLGNAVADVALVTTVLLAASLPLRSGWTATGIHMYVAVAGVSVTDGKVVIYDKNYNRLAISAAQTTAWQSTGFKTTVFATPYSVLTDDLYYAAIWCTATTPPQLAGYLGSEAGKAIGAGKPRAWEQTTASSPGATATPGATFADVPWLAVY